MADGDKPEDDVPEVPVLPVGIVAAHPVAKILLGVQIEGFEHLDVLKYDFENCWTRTHPDGPYLKDDVMAAIIASASNYATMSILLGRNRARVKDYVLGNPDVYAAFEGVEQTYLDIIERGAKMSAALGDGAMQRYILSTLGKDRGYTTRSEIAPSGDMPTDLSKYTDAELEQLAEIHRTANAR